MSQGFPPLLHSLTSLRFVAALWVVVFHFRNYFPSTALHDARLAEKGYLGVDFFFVLSGFILAHVYFAKLRDRRFDYWSFIVRRVARIYPMHIATLGLALVLGVLARRLDWNSTVWDLGAFMDLPAEMVFRGLFNHLVLIHAWGATPGLMFNLPSWSISAEWFAYLAFPAIALLIGSRRISPWLAAVLAAIALIAMEAAFVVVTGRSLLLSTWNIGALRILPEFALGVAIYRLGEHWSLSRAGAVAGFWLSLAAVVLLASFSGPDIAIVFALAGLVFCAADAERHGALAVFARPFPVLLGEVSYSLYLLHFPLGVAIFEEVVGFDTTANSFVAGAWIAGVTALLTFLSWISHRWFEIPARERMIRMGAGASPLLPPKSAPPAADRQGN